MEAESLPEDEIVKKFDAIAKKAFGKSKPLTKNQRLVGWKM